MMIVYTPRGVLYQIINILNTCNLVMVLDLTRKGKKQIIIHTERTVLRKFLSKEKYQNQN